MTKIILTGCNGRMGQAIVSLAKETDGVEIVYGVDEYDGIDNEFHVSKVMPTENVGANVLVDFSNPSMLEGNIDYCIKNNIPAIIATTGMSDTQSEMIKNASKTIPVFRSANMSVGVNLIISLCKKAAQFLGDEYDIEIIERHHNQKIDAPSGTALAIADAINESLPYDMEYEYDRHSKREKRKKHEIGIHAIRGGNIVGDHTVIFAGTNEVIEISHSAASRSVFAYGAIKAAKYMSTISSPGLYSMDDMINSVK